MSRQVGQYRYYDFVMAAFVTILLCSNLIGAAKAAQVSLPFVGNVTFGAGVLFFPVSYIFGDILTEVYGYGRDRRVIWAGFCALIFAALMSVVVLSLTPASDPFNSEYQTHLQAVFGNTPRIILGSMLAFWCGRDSEMSAEQFDVLVHRYSEFARRAADNGYRIGPETHFGPSLVVENMKRVLEAVDNPAYGILLHIGHWVPGQEEEGDRWCAPHAMHTHVDANITQTCLTEKMKLLIDRGYQGYWGVEHHSAQDEHAKVAVQLATVRQALTLLSK